MWPKRSGCTTSGWRVVVGELDDPETYRKTSVLRKAALVADHSATTW